MNSPVSYYPLSRSVSTEIDPIVTMREENNIEKSQINESIHSYSSTVTLEYPEGGKKAWMTVLGGFIGITCQFGFTQSTGAIESYISQYILQDSSDLTISMIFSIFLFILMFLSMFTGVIFDLYGCKLLTLVGGILMVSGLLATGNCTKVWQFFLAYSICCGIGASLMQSSLVTVATHFFKKRRGLAMAFVMPGANFGGVIWPLLCRSLYPKVGFTWTMRIWALVLLCGFTMSLFLISDRHVEIQNFKSDPFEDKTTSEKIQTFVDFSAVKDMRFCWITLALCMAEFSTVISITYIPSYAISKGFDQRTGLLALTVCNATGIAGRIIPTILSDYYGPFNIITIMSVIMTCSIFIIWLPFGHLKSALFVFCSIYGFAMAAIMTLTPICTAAISEPSQFGRRYGTAYFFCSFMNLPALPIAIALTKTKLQYDSMVIFSGCTTFVAVVSFVICRVKVGGYGLCKV
ncbi:hypothetical protein DAMA08_053070 [Martiniozyma asiatica (nom. inval.)]|nr:hypothetical protein DAMA08_053070 [Martiniozyma asiatica]